MTRSSERATPSVWPGQIPLQSFYTAGAAGQIFFHALKQRGKLIGTRCAPCGQVYLPARSFCERCFGALDEQVEIQRTGKLVSYTICHVDNDAVRPRQPVALALVQLEGATTLLLHRLIGVSDPKQVRLGSRVVTVIKPKKSRVGSILDIDGFRIV